MLSNVNTLKGQMKKKKRIKIDTNNDSHNKLISLLSNNTPQERAELLDDIDGIICGIFEMKKEDLPWMNPQAYTEKWQNITSNIRLVIGRLEFESKQKIKTIN